MKQAILIGCISTLVLKAPAADAPIPKVEVDYQQMDAGEWNGKRMSEMVATDSIKRIIHTHDSWTESGNDVTEIRKNYDALISHLFQSTEKAINWTLGANERTLADMVILTASGEIFRLEILKRIVKGSEVPVAVLVRGSNKSVRIEVKNFKFPITKQ